jgi:hypothetical protein
MPFLNRSSGGNTMSYRRLLVLAAIAGLPGIVSAQFTTFIPPRNKVADSVKAQVVAEQKAQVDSSIQTQLTNMKTWVDSAAGVAGVPLAVPDTTKDSLATKSAMTDSLAARSVAQVADSAVARPAPTAADTAVLRNGARAPATATSLPLLVLLGSLALLVGAILIRGAPGPVRVRTDGRDRA